MAFSPDSSYESCGSYSNSSPDPVILSLDYTRHQIISNSDPHLIMVVPPEMHFRYRYDTEMSGAHGSLQADRTGREKQIPTVQLIGYSLPAVIRVTLATCNEGTRYPHPHYLFAREKLYQRRYRNLDGKVLYKTGHFMDPHYIFVNNDSNFVGKFEGLCIISTKKENFQRTIREKLLYRGHRQSEMLEKMVQEAQKHVDIAYVCLCFEALHFENGVVGELICPPLYSAPIANAKNANSGKLKITRINKCTGSCMGGDSIWLLVEKINKKGLVVRFFEHGQDGRLEWEVSVEGDQLELHYQYAVIFNTPPYRDPDITRSVTVSMRLERRVVPYDVSEAETFVYEPCKLKCQRNDNIYRKESLFSTGLTNKRPMADLISPYDVPTKRRNEDFLLVDEPYSFDLTQNQNKEYHAILMELFRLDSVVQTDGPVDERLRERAVLKVLQALLARAKLKDDDIKAVTEKIGKLFLKPRPDEKMLQDAASTLLSLRSRASEPTAVMDAVAAGDATAVASAIKAEEGVLELNDEGQTPMHLAVKLGHKTCLSELLTHENTQSWVHVRDKNGLSALHLAISKKDEHAVTALIAGGGDVNMGDAITGRNALDMAVETRHPGIVRAVMDGFQPNHPTEETLGLSTKHLVDEAVKIIAQNSSKSGPKGTLERIAKVLNRSGRWKELACLLDISDVTDEAQSASDPAMFIFKRYQLEEKLDVDVLRGLLDALEEKEAVAVIDETLAKQFM